MNRAHAAVAGALAASVTVGCSAANPRVASPADPGRQVIALLADPDTRKTGHATVWNKAGSAELDAERESVTVVPGRPPSPVRKLGDHDVERLFGAALAALPPEPTYYTLYFKFESDELTEESVRLVPSILADVNRRADPEVAVVGHTDTLGAAKANVELGRKRGAFVAKLLVAAGLKPATIELASHGEAAPLIRTPDETPEPRNRRVEITVR